MQNGLTFDPSVYFSDVVQENFRAWRDHAKANPAKSWNNNTARLLMRLTYETGVFTLHVTPHGESPLGPECASELFDEITCMQMVAVLAILEVPEKQLTMLGIWPMLVLVEEDTLEIRWTDEDEKTDG